MGFPLPTHLRMIRKAGLERAAKREESYKPIDRPPLPSETRAKLGQNDCRFVPVDDAE